MSIDLAAAYVRHARRMACWFSKRVESPETAEDLVVDTFVKAARYANRYEDRGDHGYSLLNAIARSVLVDHYRHRGKRVPEMPHDLLMQRVPGSVPMPEGFGPDLEEALATLTAAQAAVVRLRFCDDLPIAAVAERLGTSKNAVKLLQVRGLARLSVALADWNPRLSGMDRLADEMLRASRKLRRRLAA